METELQKFIRELKIRNYSPKTLKSYLTGLREYFIFKKYSFNQLDEDNIKNFLLALEKKGKSAQTRNLCLNAIKFYYLNVIGNDRKINIKFAKKYQKLPIVLSKRMSSPPFLKTIVWEM